MPIQIEQIVTGRWRENCYLVRNEGNYSLIIDPGSESEKLISAIVERDLHPVAILNTHAHYDHMGAVEALKREFKALFYLHSEDEKTLKQANLYRTLLGGDEKIPIPSIDFYLDKATSPLRIKSFEIEVIPTPGHTPGGVCFRMERHLFTGDTLFQGAVGRTDLPGSNPQDLNASLRRIRQLPTDLRIYPGHGKTSSLAKELKTNRALIGA